MGLSPSPSVALTVDADRQFSFAEAAFDGEDYNQSIAEYKRFLHFFPDDPRGETARFRIGMAHFRMNRFSEAAADFQKVIEGNPYGPAAGRAGLMIADCRFKLKDRDGAVISLRQLIRDTKDPGIRDAAWFRMGWLFIEEGSWEQAGRAFGQVSPVGGEKFHTEEISAALASARTLKQKNPVTAGALSILPGAGHLYCGRPRDAMIALLLNGALIGVAWEAFDEDLPWLGGLASFVELGVYSGTLYSAVNSAHKYNHRSKRRFIDQLKHRFPTRISLAPAPGGLQLSLAYEF